MKKILVVISLLVMLSACSAVDNGRVKEYTADQQAIHLSGNKFGLVINPDSSSNLTQSPKGLSLSDSPRFKNLTVTGGSIFADDVKANGFVQATNKIVIGTMKGEDQSIGGNTYSIVSPILKDDQTIVLPTTSGSAGQCMMTDGKGNLSWGIPKR